MKQSQIREIYEAAKRNHRMAQAVLAKAEGELHYVQRFCDHPDSFRRSVMGEMETYCPDCGYQS